MQSSIHHQFSKVYAIILLLTIGHVRAEEQIADHIRKCCINGLRHARITNKCDGVTTSVLNIPHIYFGMCSSTFGVCCSRELERQSCDLGRLAALEGSKCDKQPDAGGSISSNSSFITCSTTYTACCRACQVGLAVKASQQNCRDPLFSFLTNIESYRICCSDKEFSESDEEVLHNPAIEFPEDAKVSDVENNEGIKNSQENSDGTIVLKDDDDICGKVPNLCQQICENTFDAYKCSCNPGYVLDDNNVTCTWNKINKTTTKQHRSEISGSNVCPIGYVLATSQGQTQSKCVDIDECKEELHKCKTTQYCHNTIGGYRCLNVKATSCEEGYRYNIDTDQCEDENECKRSPSPCNSGLQCINYPGGYECQPGSIPLESRTCGIGYYLQDDRCTDIDECQNGTTNTCNADLHQECKNTLGSYHCNCLPGFSLDVTQHECVDINECSINNHNCLPTQRCDNTIGSYMCTRYTSCGTGYTLNAQTGQCDDDDECAVGTHNCPPNYDCYNTIGSFRCHRTTTTTTTTTTHKPSTAISMSTTKATTPKYVAHQVYSHLNYTPSFLTHIADRRYLPACTTGFFRNHLGACVDVNECIELQPCKSHERCHNTNGSYRCESLLHCPVGFKSTTDGSSCIDINECETGEHNCDDKQICHNRNGGYICACPTGHQVTRLSNGINSCVDIDECSQDQPPCSSNAHCFNTIGSFYCECKSGFQKNLSNDKNIDETGNTHNAQCFDVDECQTIPGLCQQKCVNFWGGYRCTCNPGYQLSRDNRTCNDIDECEVHKDYKLCMGICFNSAGSYQCSCPRGYTLAADKTSCHDIDECAGSTGMTPSNHVCTGRNDVCTNIRGNYKCTTINCPHGYIKDPDVDNRCRQSSNFCEGEECYTKPSAYTYNFITFISKLMIPPDGRTIFTLRGPVWYDDIDFDLKILRVQAASNIERASDRHFDILKNKNQVNLILKRSLEGPQDIELDLSMTVFTKGMPRGKSVAKLFLFVSQYTF
ncbi:fibulin-1 isoform X2 [Drosophila busckii]|uniref:fibulin-1 isoform X2 n=1 Tax=Drosophila busckii TaxID=30019 RepID=UPI00083EDCCC|nr:fibulin-1 isoform X2 [Drosophila busckii]